MRALYQIVCYTFTLFIALFVGSVFDEAFEQAYFWAKHVLGNRPLPMITDILIRHHDMPFYVILLPWLLFVGAPLLSLRTAEKYWDSTDFFLRFITFSVIETLAFLIFLFAVANPFIPQWVGMESLQEGKVEFTLHFLFWIVSCLVLLGVLIRIIQLRHPHHELRNQP